MSLCDHELSKMKALQLGIQKNCWAFYDNSLHFGSPHFSLKENSSCRYLEVCSADGRISLFLRAKEEASAQSWFNAIHSNISILLPRVKEELKALQSGLGIVGNRDIKHIGWLTEQVRLGFLV